MSEILAMFEAARRTTMGLVSTLKADDYVVQTAEYTSPPKWHIGHMSWIYEMVMRKIDPSYEPTRFAKMSYLNSYYNQAGSPHPKAARGNVARPTAKDLLEYFEETNGIVADFVQTRRLDAKSEKLMIMAVNHEYQHQELLVYDLQHMLASDYAPASKQDMPDAGQCDVAERVHVKGGMYEMGHSDDTYCYDIESPQHRVHLEDYEIDAFPVTCGQYAEFIAAGGYDKYRYWLSDGWDAVQRYGWSAPMYWENDGGQWMVHDFAGRRRIDEREPVCCVSYYEADAYCRWASRRLPSEEEWEVAACYDISGNTKSQFPWGDKTPDETHANLLESNLWRRSRTGSYSAGASTAGCSQMIGDVWEWTSSEFAPYPGFVSGFDEYNDKWFGGQKVLRGGSSATPRASIRTTYRNFFRPHERWMFAGFRCAS